jgi:hypothetical protein
MRRTLSAARRQIVRLDCTAPLASQDLGFLASRVVAEMLQDLEGWAQIASVKAVEAG